MAATGVLYNAFKARQLGSAPVNLSSDTIKVALCSSSYTPNIDSHSFFSDITNEVSNSGTYSAGGATLANKSTSQDNTDDEGVFDADDVTFTTATITARYAILYKDTGISSTSPLIGYVDFGADVTSTVGTFTIPWVSEGIINLN
jgi:hypothetical protein